MKKVTEDYEGLRFNTGISQLMVFINDAYKADVLPKEYIEGFVKLLAPVTPHIAEELWSKLGHEGTLPMQSGHHMMNQSLSDNEIEIVLQVNGKVRAKLTVPRDISKDELEKIALQDEKVQEFIEGKTVRKVIAVPGKLVNIVAN